MKDAGNYYRLYTDETNNRVYRAPAYYRSAEMEAVHFNPNAVLAQQTTDGGSDIYPGMTAIDFTGYNDVSKGYKKGITGGVFYAPLLDDAGLTRIRNVDETQNLLVYTPVDGVTHEVLNDYFTDPTYAEGDYRTVAVNGQSVRGHLVRNTQDGMVSDTDHLLIDKQDFNCPIAYTFADDKRMWYQRQPDRYVNLTRGWETVSLPFTAELVTTQNKGEITHFYSGSRTVDGETMTGHEYWLREYVGKKALEGDILTATFNYPTAGGADKTVNNTFLWDYYYSQNTRLDNNGDTYQTYYETSRNYESYPLLSQSKPYIIGFPGSTYYEFDLSGEWTVQNTALPAPVKLSRQTITFASEPGIDVKVSDTELTAQAQDGYTFMPNYMNTEVAGYVMNNSGNRFEYSEEATAEPFRPYFLAGSPSKPSPRHVVNYIVFDSEETPFAFGEEPDPSGEDHDDGELRFYVRNHQIGIISTLRHETQVSIYTIGGQPVEMITVQPNQTAMSRYLPTGIYIANKKKLYVK